MGSGRAHFLVGNLAVVLGPFEARSLRKHVVLNFQIDRVANITAVSELLQVVEQFSGVSCRWGLRFVVGGAFVVGLQERIFLKRLLSLIS